MRRRPPPSPSNRPLSDVSTHASVRRRPAAFALVTSVCIGFNSRLREEATRFREGALQCPDVSTHASVRRRQHGPASACPCRGVSTHASVRRRPRRSCTPARARPVSTHASVRRRLFDVVDNKFSDAVSTHASVRRRLSISGTFEHASKFQLTPP